MNKNENISYLETFSNVIISITVFLLPLFFLINTTDFFIIPKQLLIISSTALLLTIWAIKIIIERKIVVTANPFNLPIALFGMAVLVSAILSRNRFDSLIQAVPVIFVLLLFFSIVNNVRERRAFLFVLSFFVLGAAASSLISILYYFKFYFLPFAQIQSQTFNTFGSIVQSLIYLIPIFVLSILYIGQRLKFPKLNLSSPNLKADFGFFVQFMAFLSVLAGVLLIFYQILFSPNKPIVLPYIYGFQTSFASISQDAQRFIVSLVFGSGYGTFLVDFTRFKLPSFNLEQNIWNLSFAYSSSFLLELIATTGLLGALSFIFIIATMIKSHVVRNPIFVALFTVFVLSLLLPFAYSSVALLFVLLAIYVAFLNIEGDKKVYEVTLSLIATKGGMLSFERTTEPLSPSSKIESPILPGVAFIIIILFVGFFAFWTFKFANSDIKFAQSLREASLNNGQKTYQLESQSIAEFPWRSDYHRVFSQVNLALANSLGQSIQPNASPSAQTAQNIITLLQQSINSARNAITLSPLTSLNWQNLGQIYRSLINVGQNAESFAVASMNQAIALDPYNPQLYIQLGGIYYQLKQWDEAQNRFQIAINLKRDFANAYYNLGHVFESKGDLQNALSSYQIVRQLSAGNKDNLAKIEGEIKVLEAKIGETAKQAQGVEPETNQTPLSISGPSVQLPEQKPPIKISPPPDGEASASPSAQ